jgi:hypothetical protein
MRRHASMPGCQNRGAIIRLQLTNPAQKTFARRPLNDTA